MIFLLLWGLLLWSVYLRPTTELIKGYLLVNTFASMNKPLAFA